MSFNHIKTYSLTQLIQAPTIQRIAFSTLYVIVCLLIGYLFSSSTPHEQKARYQSSGVKFSALKTHSPRVRRHSRYSHDMSRLTGVLQVRSRHEQCTAILIHERMILTEGNCARSLGFDALKGQSWSATSQHIPHRIHARFQGDLKAKVIESRVNPALKLAVHQLDKALPYAPLHISVDIDHPLYEDHHEWSANRVDRRVRQFGSFIVSRKQNSAKVIILGRSKGHHFEPLTNEATKWIHYAQNQLTQSHLSYPKDLRPVALLSSVTYPNVHK
jgi:hypothetical protein